MSWNTKIGHFGNEYCNVEATFTGEGSDAGFLFGDLVQFKYGGVAPADPADAKLEDAEIEAQVVKWNAAKDAALADWREKTAYEKRWNDALSS